jgi:hypothetical protein
LALVVAVVTSTTSSAVNAQTTVNFQANHDASSDIAATIERLRGLLERLPVLSTNTTIDTLSRISSEALAVAETQSAGRQRAELQFFAADALDRQLRYADALSAYRASLRSDPSSPYAGRAQARVASLESDQAQQFAALIAVQRFRNAHQDRAASIAEVEPFVTALQALEPCPAKTQGLLLAARALHDAHATEAAVRLLSAVSTERTTSLDHRAIAMHQLAMIREEMQDFSTASADLSRLHADPREVTRMRRLHRRQLLVRVSWILIVAQWVLGLGAIVDCVHHGRTALLVRQWTRPLPLMHLGVLTLGGALLTRSYDNHEIGHVWALGIGALLAYGCASAMSIWIANLQRFALLLKCLMALLSALAVLGVSFLAMAHFDSGMLDGISL